MGPYILFARDGTFFMAGCVKARILELVSDFGEFGGSLTCMRLEGGITVQWQGRISALVTR